MVSNKIIFTRIIDVTDDFAPQPAGKLLPEWYKKMKSYIDSNERNVKEGTITSTVKKCVPVFDALTSGYIISLHADIWIGENNGDIMINWRSGGDSLITKHEFAQVLEYPNASPQGAFKFFNPWAIKTPKGYSCLFVPPLNAPNQYFTIFSGIVDTDTYLGAVHFPFTLNDPNFRGLIPAGTPIAQVIPFKRERWNMKFGGKKELDLINKSDKRLAIRWFDSYKTQFWHRKEYK